MSFSAKLTMHCMHECRQALQSDDRAAAGDKGRTAAMMSEKTLACCIQACRDKHAALPSVQRRDLEQRLASTRYMHESQR